MKTTIPILKGGDEMPWPAALVERPTCPRRITLGSRRKRGSKRTTTGERGIMASTRGKGDCPCRKLQAVPPKSEGNGEPGAIRLR